ncbi:hypothetical protein Q9K01_06835 [Qipengyuania sp. DY56-A-20]|jgi:hypothetical protein|uniref:Uncharacterized protein n=1 Tax=Qipengyuania benthica TaxID=3067651 RepID=A0ABT9H8H7_9SPHN|nr:hypothetical protein [Qipengyuania sp. DY56-A-20]MDP4539334.1 hypothetical protein [Qipengyuania sp. DY56-A-20]
MRNLFSSLALALVLTGAPASAAEPAQKEVQGEKKPEAAPQQASEAKQICRRVAIQTGSRQRERVCMTSEQWREFNRGN